MKGKLRVSNFDLPIGTGTSGSPIFSTTTHEVVSMHEAAVAQVYSNGWMGYGVAMKDIVGDMKQKLARREVDHSMASRLKLVIESAESPARR